MGERHHFLLSRGDLRGDRFHLNGGEGHHLARVARVAVGEEIFLLDSTGRAYQGAVETIAGDRVEGSIVKVINDYHEPPVTFHLGIGILKGAKLDMVMEKGTELGVGSITPLTMAHNVRKGVSVGRLASVARAAAKQCGRGRIPEVCEPVHLMDWCEGMDARFSAVMHNSGTSTPVSEWLRRLSPRVSDVWITVGPEGGFSQKELKMISEKGIETLSLGPRRLRSETAAISALVLLDNHFSVTRNHE